MCIGKQHKKLRLPMGIQGNSHKSPSRFSTGFRLDAPLPWRYNIKYK